MNPILIIGAGPVGLSLALGLIRQGRRVIVVDQRPSIPQDPRATTLQPPVLELYERLGVLQAMLDRGLIVRSLQYWNWTARKKIADFDYADIAGDTTCPYRLHITQAATCEVLLAAIEAAAPGTVHWGERATEVLVSNEAVQLSTTSRQGPDGLYRGTWLCGADGMKSWTRKQIGVDYIGPTKKESFLVAQVDRGAVDYFSKTVGEPMASVSYLFLRNEWAMLMELPDQLRVLFHVGGDGQEELGPKATRTRARALLGRTGMELRSLGLYNVRLRLASTLHHGRVVLVGDAAHAGYPVGGTAMNSGILDAEHLISALVENTDEAMVAYGKARHKWNKHYLLGETSRAVANLKAHWPWSRAFRTTTISSLGSSAESRRKHLLQVSMMAEKAGI